MRLLSIISVVFCTAALAPAAGTAATPSGASASAACPWLDARRPPDARARQLLSAMTLDDKLQMVHGDGLGGSFPTIAGAGLTVNDLLPGPTSFGAVGHVPGIPRLCIPDLVMNDGVQGLAEEQPGATAFPAGIGQAATFDSGLQRAFGDAVGQEARRRGVNVILGPDVNAGRNPQFSRNFEAFGEDPFLAGSMAVATIDGVQAHHVIGTVKHLAAYDQGATMSSDVDERTLHELYLTPFEAAVRDAHVGAVMCSYNPINSVQACENPTTLTTALKNQFAHRGFVMSDWGGTHSTVASARAGLDMEMAGGVYYGPPLRAAVASGQVPVRVIDGMVRRILVSMFRLGLFDDPTPARPAAAVAGPEAAHVALSRRIAEQGTVLLKNEGGLLPLTKPSQTLGIIGFTAGPIGAAALMQSPNSPDSRVLSPAIVSPLQGITPRAAEAGDRVLYADGSATADAVAVVSASDVVVLFAYTLEGELPGDRSGLGLPGNQDALIAAVAGANPKTAVVLNSGGPVTMPWVNDVKAVLAAWYPGQEGGNAIASVLFGDVDPAGRLPESFPRSVADLPAHTPQQYPGVNGHAVYSEGMLTGYRWYDAKGIEPLFPFGHGLSYTRFRYANLRAPRTSDGTAAVAISVDIRNVGSRKGSEVAQVYVGWPSGASVKAPRRQLRGFTRLSLGAGKAGRVRIALDRHAFSYWDAHAHRWRVQPGCYPVFVGRSSRDLRLTARIAAGDGAC